MLQCEKIEMPGENCAVVGCGTCRRTKGVGIFKVPKEEPWRGEFLNQITKSRVVDSAFSEMIKRDRVYVCEKHFREEDFETCM